MATRGFCSCCANLPLAIRTFSTSNTLAGRYKIWPDTIDTVRRTGRRPNEWKGQGGRKGRIPYDKRYPLSGKDINDSTEGLKRGGNAEMNKMIGVEKTKNNPAVISYYDYVKDREMIEIVPEMIPEFVVPDLTDFKLKPYVTYRLDEDVAPNPIPTRSKHTPEELFKETYQPTILKQHNKELAGEDL